MITYETFERCPQERTGPKALPLSNIVQYFLVIPGNATDKRYRQVATMIGYKMNLKKITETANHQFIHIIIVEMVVDEGGERSQKTVGQWFSIDTTDHIGQRHLHKGLEFRLDFF